VDPIQPHSTRQNLDPTHGSTQPMGRPNPWVDPTHGSTQPMNNSASSARTRIKRTRIRREAGRGMPPPNVPTHARTEGRTTRKHNAASAHGMGSRCVKIARRYKAAISTNLHRFLRYVHHRLSTLNHAYWHKIAGLLA